MGTFHTQDSVHILEQHTNSLSQTLQYNRISSLFSHRTNSKVLLLPFIHYHIDSNSTCDLQYTLFFRSLIYNIDGLVFLICALCVRSEYRLTSYSIRRLECPCGARTFHHAIAPATDQATYCGRSTRGT